jgi:hypothetical protein
MPKKNPSVKHRETLNTRQWAFSKLLFEGVSQSDAYRAIYQPNAKGQRAAEEGHRIAKLPAVVAELERLRALSTAKTLLTVNDQLAILARNAQAPARTAAERSACARNLEVYAKIAGTQAPERHEVTGKDGAPIAVSAAVNATVTATVTRLTVRERIRLLKERREKERAERERGEQESP